MKKCYLLCFGVLSLTFTLDTVTPLGIAAGIPYVAVVLLAAPLPRRSILAFAAICTALTAIAFFKPPGSLPQVEWLGLTNRILTVIAIWLTVMFALSRKSAEDALKKHRDGLEQVVQERTASITQLHLQLEAAIIDQLKEEQAKLRLFQSTMRTVKDLVNNFLNELQLIRLEMEAKGTVDPPTSLLLQKLIFDASAKLNALGELKELKETDLGGGIYILDTEPHGVGDPGHEAARSNQ